MDTTYVLRQLSDKDILSETEYREASARERSRPISVHIEVRVLLAVGIALISGGLGTLVYKHIDTYGHMAIIALITLAIAGLGRYIFSHRQPYTNSLSRSYSTIVDYALLLACTLFLILEGYLHAQYRIFGDRYGVATLIPAILFFYLAYRFDHKGVLTMAITAFTAWVGCSWDTVSGAMGILGLPWMLSMKWHDYKTLSHIGLGVGCGQVIVGAALHSRNIKRHFTDVYYLIGFNMACSASLSRALDHRAYCLVALILSAIAIAYARRQRSPRYYIPGVIHAYLAFTLLIWKFRLRSGWLLYGVISCAALAFLFVNYKQILGIKRSES